MPCFEFVSKTMLISHWCFSHCWAVARLSLSPHSALTADRLGVGKKPGGDAARTAVPNWPKGYSTPTTWYSAKIIVLETKGVTWALVHSWEVVSDFLGVICVIIPTSPSFIKLCFCPSYSSPFPFRGGCGEWGAVGVFGCWPGSVHHTHGASESKSGTVQETLHPVWQKDLASL